jgi:peptidoglycan/LPS O-acetylase OafA/YrhL
MRKFRLIIALISVAIIIGLLFTIDYQNLISRPNLGNFLGIIAMMFNILAMILSNRHEAKNKF